MPFVLNVLGVLLSAGEVVNQVACFSMILRISSKFAFEFSLLCLYLHRLFKIVHRLGTFLILELILPQQLAEIQMVELGAVEHPSHDSCELEILKVIGIIHHIISGNQLVVNISDRLVGEVLILIVLL